MGALSLRQKLGMRIAGVKSLDVDVSTSRGNLFMTLTSTDFAKYFATLWGKYSDSELVNMYHGTPEVFSAVYHRASRLAHGKYAIRKKANNEPVTDNKELNRLMSTPNPLQNFQELIYEIEAYACVTGKNYLYANIPDTLPFKYKNISTLVNLFADVTSVRTKATIKMLSATNVSDLVESYDCDGQTIKPEKVMVTKFTSLQVADRKINGIAPLLSAKKALDNLDAVWAARNAQYRKHGALGFLVSDKTDQSGNVTLTPKELKDANDTYASNYGFEGDKKTVGVAAAPLKFIKVGGTIQELQPFEETEASASAVYAVLAVPRSLMPRKEGATYENAKQDERSFYQNVIIPRAQSLCQSLTNFLGLDAEGLYMDVSFDHIDVLQENRKEKAESDWKNNETYRVRFLHGIVTLNDWRVAAGMEKATGGIYDKLILDMTPDEMLQVEALIKLSKGGNSAGNNQIDPNANPGTQ